MIMDRESQNDNLQAENARLEAGIKSAIDETYDDGVRDLLGDILYNDEDCKDRKRYDKDAYEGLNAVLKSKEAENQRLKEENIRLKRKCNGMYFQIALDWVSRWEAEIIITEAAQPQKGQDNERV